MTQPDPAAFWDQRYADARVSFGTEPNVYLASQAGLFKAGQRVLVPGDGEGRNGVWLAQHGLHVDTVDASATGAANARTLAAERGVSISAVAADLTTWAWPVAAYDAVVSIYLHFHADVRAAMHVNMLASLKPGGFVLLEGYTPQQMEHRKSGSIGGPHDVAMLFTPAQLRSDFAGAEIVSLTEAEVTLSEGTRHRGPSSVVRLIARKPG